MNGGAYAHLHPEVRAAADLPDEQRIECIRAERWITHLMAATALALLQEVLDQSPRERMEGQAARQFRPRFRGLRLLRLSLPVAHLPQAERLAARWPETLRTAFCQVDRD
ncbi:hypothetical protein [Paracraurococcus lichenis]|uniref:Transposase DDE domain-containing protein n=1 Tax=Paracraurococcus lichenis TaxID=3064888 RepID=A0ABT9EDX7_9PROT|nr:hypothetical protein [Paracraurococcus sp. LOR1-02]MDO9714422.1 hypothetical protein [Paracraurococcus sp. LOR1-02]